jgi:hypothetical protein
MRGGKRDDFSSPQKPAPALAAIAFPLCKENPPKSPCMPCFLDVWVNGQLEKGRRNINMEEGRT